MKSLPNLRLHRPRFRRHLLPELAANENRKQLSYRRTMRCLRHRTSSAYKWTCPAIPTPFVNSFRRICRNKDKLLNVLAPNLHAPDCFPMIKHYTMNTKWIGLRFQALVVGYCFFPRSMTLFLFFDDHSILIGLQSFFLHVA